MTTSANAPAIAEATIRELSQRHGEPAWLLERRLAALRAYDAMAMPDPMEETWRRTDLSGFDLGAVVAATLDDLVKEAANAGSIGLEVFPMSGETPKVVYTSLAQAAVEHEALVKQHFESLVLPTEWKLQALASALRQDGAFIHVPRGVEVEVPIRHLARASRSSYFPHLLIVAEDGSSVTVDQTTSTRDAAQHRLVSGAVEIIAGRDARVRFVETQDWGPEVYAFSTIRATLAPGAEVTASIIGLGARLSRTKLEVDLAGEGSHAELLGLALGDDKQHFDYITLQDHTGARTSSDLLFKAALDGASSMVWNGTVRIQKGATASQANQTSRNLLLSDKAKAAPIPVLEIEAHDVLQCSHGASAGPLDEEQRFYLESRGIPPAEAERLLVEAFFREVIDRLPEGNDKDALADRILKKIGAQS
jgi:Fe-S cluster assembly protein SufD